MLRRLAEVGQNRYVGAAVVGSIAGLILLLLFLLIRGQRDTVVLQVQPVEDSSIVRVYVGGAVADPGLVTLARGSRVADAIDAAGGMLNSADVTSLGLASRLQDADQIIVPSKASTPAPAVQSSAESPGPPAAALPSAQQDNPVTVDRSATQPAPVHLPADTPININTAVSGELEALPGIGPAIANRIVEYRTLHGPFQSLEELSAVSGISARMVEDLWPLITLGY